jgi:hypothetical protein
MDIEAGCGCDDVCGLEDGVVSGLTIGREYNHRDRMIDRLMLDALTMVLGSGAALTMVAWPAITATSVSRLIILLIMVTMTRMINMDLRIRIFLPWLSLSMNGEL